MPYSYAVYTGNGATTQFTVPFPYLRREHVVASLDYVSAVFTWVNNTTVEISPAPANGVRVEVRRVTPVNSPLVDFTDGSTLVAADLDTNALQQTYINQEQDDQIQAGISINAQGLLDAGGKRITNVGDPTAAQDAVTKSWVETAGASPLVQFRSIFYGADVTDPSVDPYGAAPTEGDLYFNSTLDQLRIFNGASWQGASANASVTRFKFTAVGGETSLSGNDDNGQSLTYNVGLELVYLNGALLTRGVDYVGTTGSSITGLAALSAADLVEVVVLSQINAIGSIPSANSTFLQTGANAVQRTVDSKLKDVVSAKDFGAVGDGVTNDTAAIQAAIDSLGSSGGVVNIVGKHYLGSNLVVKPNVFLVGSCRLPGRSTLGSGAATDYSAMGSSLRVASSATIELRGGAGLEGLLVYRHGMTFPATPSSTASAFAGTAVTIAGDDASVRGCLIMGFNKAIYSSGAARLRVDYLYHDNINGIEVTICDDVIYITNSHAWPFATIVSGQSWQNLIRSGTAYYIHDFVDWARITDCFSYGYSVGFRVKDANSAILTACGADNAYDGSPLYANSIGYSIDGVAYETKLISCQAAAQASAGMFVNVTSNIHTLISDASIWGGGNHGILLNNGDTTVSGGVIRDYTHGITTANGTQEVLIDGVTFTGINGVPVNVFAASKTIHISNCSYADFTGLPVLSSLTAPSVASADPLILPNSGDIFTVTGTTSFGTLGHGWLGREVTLVFTGNLSVFSGIAGTPGAMKLLNNATLSAGATSTLSLKHNGVQWYETGRN